MLQAINQLLTEHAHWLSYLAFASIVFFLLSLFFIPLLVARIPSDYFQSPNKQRPPLNSYSWQAVFLKLVRTILGLLLIVAGIVMLVLPGQGILTILAGLFVLDFPGKYKLERYLVQKPAVLNSLNWIRRKQNIPEIHIH